MAAQHRHRDVRRVEVRDVARPCSVCLEVMQCGDWICVGERDAAHAKCGLRASRRDRLEDRQ